MNSLTSVAPAVLSLGGAAFVVAVLVQATKGLLNYIIPPTSPQQNTVVRVYVYAVALIFTFGYQWLHFQLNGRSDVSVALGTAFTVAGLSIAIYHVLDSNTVPTIPLGTFTSLTPIQGEEPATSGVITGTAEPATPPAA